MQIAILGAGMVGRAMAIDLAKQYQVTSFDVSLQSLQLLHEKDSSITTTQADLNNYASYNLLLNGFDFVVTNLKTVSNLKAKTKCENVSAENCYK